MRISKINLENFRCFDKLELDLHPDMTVLVGANGAGKTACVDGVGVALQVIPMALGYKAPGIHAHDLRATTSSHQGYWSTEEAESCRVTATPSTGSVSGSWSFERRGGKKRNSRVGAGEALRQIRKLAARNGTGEAGVTMPMVALYGIDRLQSQVKTAAQLDKLPKRLDAYRTSIRPLTSFAEQLKWLRWQATAAAQSGDPTPHLLAVYRAAASCLPDAKKIRYDLRSLDLWVEFKDKPGTPYHLLSDGYKGVLAMVIDIAWRCVTLNPHLAERAPEETPGVVVIDEVDLHLHPTWQRKVLGDLRRTFPCIQFVVTSHSPQILASCQPEWVRVLDGQGQIHRVDYVHGWDSNSVLRDVMGDDVRPEFARDLLEQISVAIDEERWEKAEQLIDALAVDLGPDAPELTEVRLDLSFERGVGDA